MANQDINSIQDSGIQDASGAGGWVAEAKSHPHHPPPPSLYQIFPCDF